MGRISLWLVPTPAEAEKLKTLMRPPANTGATDPTSYPSFHPHVTLAGIPDSAVLETAALLRQTAPPAITIKFDKIMSGDRYHQSVYIAVRPTPELVKMHLQLSSGVMKEAFPHFSLCYIADADAAKGERARFEQGLGVREVQPDGGVEVKVGEEAGEEMWIGSYRVAEVWFVRCSGPVDQWQVLERVPIPKPY